MNVLIATDGSEAGEAALETGLELAAEHDDEAVIVHVMSILDLDPDWGDGDAQRPAQRITAPEQEPVLVHALERADALAVRARVELLVGHPSRQIARLADELDSDLIVVGSRGLSALKRAIMGSTSRELLELSTRPIMIVRVTPAAVPATGR